MALKAQVMQIRTKREKSRRGIFGGYRAVRAGPTCGIEADGKNLSQ
jgi:hypothetical protein